MIQRIPAEARHLADHGWLKTNLLFSFAGYYDPANMHFGSLRVFNDDHIAAHNGFSEHEHDNMEIVTIVLEGELTHKDSMGNIEKIKAGEVQHMSAGSGITHAEMNESDEPVHLYQLWIFPTALSLPTRYGQKDFSGKPKNALVPVASGEGKEGALPMQTDATVYLAGLDSGKTIDFSLAANRGAFIYVSSGQVSVNGIKISALDQARIKEEPNLRIEASEDSSFVLIDVPLVDGE